MTPLTYVHHLPAILSVMPACNISINLVIMEKLDLHILKFLMYHIFFNIYARGDK